MTGTTPNPPPDDQDGPPPPPGPPGSYGTSQPPPGDWRPGTPSAPPPYAASGGVGQPADVMPRFLARLVDYVLLAVVNGILISMVVAGIMLGGDTSALSPWRVGSGAEYAASAVSTLLTTAITLGYFALMESSRGQTIGKMLLKLETRGPGGGRPTLEQAIRRNLFTAIGVLAVIPYLGFVASAASLVAVIMIAVTISNHPADRHGWHDDFAGGTTVYKIG